MTLKAAIAISYLLAACSTAGMNGSATPKGNTQSPASGQAAVSSPDNSPAGSADGVKQDSETMKSTAPVQVSGAFLTSNCDLASASDGFVAVADQDVYGCAIQNSDKTKYKGPVTFSSVTVNYLTDPGTLAALNEAPAGSRWHTYFYLPAAEHGQVKSYHLAGAVDTNQAFDLVFTPAAGATPASSGTLLLYDATQAAAAKKAASAAEDTIKLIAALASGGATSTGCKPKSTEYTVDPALPWAMDSANVIARSTLSGDDAKGGKPIVLPVNSFKDGDVISLSSYSGQSSVYIANGVSNPDYLADCPSGWLLHFLDAKGKILNLTDALLPSFKNTPKGIPAGTASATIGYNEPAKDKKTYVDNEGNPALTLKTPVGGCHYKFTVTHACK